MEQQQKENKYKIEEIIWNDCRSIKNEWQSIQCVIDEYKKLNPIIKIVGYNILEDENILILAASIDKEDVKDITPSGINGGIVVYKPQIISRRIISNG